MAQLVAQPGLHPRVPILASLMAFGAGVIWSLGALTTRLSTDTDAWQYLMWRSIGVLVVMEFLTCARRCHDGPRTIRNRLRTHLDLPGVQ